MTSMISVVHVTAALTAAVLVMICLMSAGGDQTDAEETGEVRFDRKTRNPRSRVLEGHARQRNSLSQLKKTLRRARRRVCP